VNYGGSSQKEIALEIAHVLFIDIIVYSTTAMTISAPRLDWDCGTNFRSVFWVEPA
jgi:hypothetical protein